MIIFSQDLNEGLYITTDTGQTVYIKATRTKEGTYELEIDSPILPVTTVEPPD